MIPTLESERLVLRGWRKEDFPAHAAFYADHKRMRYVGGPKSEWEAWTVFAAMLGEWVLSGYGLFAVHLNETRSVIGRVGLWHPSYREPELAWSLYAGFGGRRLSPATASSFRGGALAGVPHLPRPTCGPTCFAPYSPKFHSPTSLMSKWISLCHTG
ncbi:GNAT family N-acetyltransferase [Mesorhizobium sp.]|uniref:GNAT family N-acetyltransferase n=1 Tax=Mesorhizobium sp. TaxID=1871066 RepID=UPI00257A50BF|nr:GNAT family N-acetyltransferase [Mesorhizobium sp.]